MWSEESCAFHSFVRPTFLGTPQPGRVIIAKALTSAAAGFVFGLVATGFGAGVGTLVMSARGALIQLGGGDYARLIDGGAGAASLWAVIGLALGALVRN
jgi:hypothetical protein